MRSRRSPPQPVYRASPPHTAHRSNRLPDRGGAFDPESLPLSSVAPVSSRFCGLRPAAQFVVRNGLLGGVFTRELCEASFDLPPDPADGNAEDALSALNEVDDFVRRGALVNAGAVAHQGDLGQVFHTAFAQVLNGGTDLLQRDTGSSSRLTTFRTRMSRKP